MSKHAKFSASGMERFEQCPGSAELSAGQPDKSSPWAIEGTQAHAVLEEILKTRIEGIRVPSVSPDADRAMRQYGSDAASFIMSLWKRCPESEILVETKVNLDLISPDMGCTFDGAVIEHFGILDVIDYKYGQGVPVSPVDNLQMATYGVGLAALHHWNFKTIRLWIIQPRIKSYDGPVVWELPMLEFKERYVPRLQKIIERAKAEPETYIEGPHCHWCKAKNVCPLRREAKLEKTRSVFQPINGGQNGKEEKEKSGVSEADWKKEAEEKRRLTRRRRADAAGW
jgi:hypothetical protein